MSEVKSRAYFEYRGTVQRCGSRPVLARRGPDLVNQLEDRANVLQATSRVEDGVLWIVTV